MPRVTGVETGDGPDIQSTAATTTTAAAATPSHGVTVGPRPGATVTRVDTASRSDGGGAAAVMARAASSIAASTPPVRSIAIHEPQGREPLAHLPARFRHPPLHGSDWHFQHRGHLVVPVLA